MVKGVGGNPQHHMSQALKLGVPLVILLICWAHGVQVTDLFVIMKTQHIGQEGSGLSNWEKLMSILFLFVVQRVNCCHRVCLVKVLLEFLNAFIHFGVWGFTLIPIINHHRHKCFPITPTEWMGDLDTVNDIQVGVDVLQMGLVDRNML